MRRTQLACYSLLASAFLLVGLILLQASRLIDNAAHADMVVNKDAVTMITTESPIGGAEVVYILDSRSGKLLAYTLNANARTFETFATMDIAKEFAGAAREAGGARPRGGK